MALIVPVALVVSLLTTHKVFLYRSSMSSEDFFNQNTSPPGQTAALKARRRAAPPPPPRPAGNTASSSGTSSSYYNTGTTSTSTSSATSQRRTAAPPPPRQSATLQQQRQQQQSSSTSHASTNVPSFYGTAGGYSSSTATSAPPAAASTASTSYYATPAPAAAASTFPSATTTSDSNTTTGMTGTADGWYSAPAPAAAPAQNNDWYSAPQQQQEQTQQYSQQPSYTDFTQPKHQTLAGTMDGSSQAFSVGTTTTFTPSQPATMQSCSNIGNDGDDDFDNEPPLMEELGINMQHILLKTKAVVLPFSRFGVDQKEVMHEDDNDLAGPLVFALLLGGELMLTGKLQFSYIYGFGLFGCLSMTLILNLMSPVAVSIWTVASILGYALLPVNVLAVVKIFVVNLGKFETIGALLAVLTIAWCTVASTRLLEQKCGMRDQRYLVAYPIALLYSAFVMITIF